MPPITLPESFATQDVRLRPATDKDATAVHAACQDPEIQKWTRVPSPYALEDAHTFVQLSTKALAEGTGAHLVVEGVDDGLLRGAVGIDVEWRDRAGEIGYWVAPDARRQGVATTAARLLCAFAFGELGLARLQLMTCVDNEASNAVARALGFEVEGTLRAATIVGPSGDEDAPRADAFVYGLLPGELAEGG